MDLVPTGDIEAIREAAATFLAEAMPLSSVRQRLPEAWRQLAEMGLIGAGIPEAAGGSGLGHAGEALVFVELGRQLAPFAAIGSAVAAGLAQRGGDSDLARRLVGGERAALAVAGGRLIDAADAAWFVSCDGGKAGLHPLESTGALRSGFDVGTMQAARPDAAAIHADETGALHLTLLAAAYALGAAEAARDLAAEYSRTREQFGKPIGAFQAIKHPIADMAVRCMAVRAQLTYAGLALDEGSADAGFHVAAARRLAGSAAIDNARWCIQTHGGMGMTDECDAHLPLKRAHALEFVAPADRAVLLGIAA
jgi:alkylation response protein AidB-like acyl-CoA dehydrogenase